MILVALLLAQKPAIHRLEAETAKLTGPKVVSQGSGHSGAGFVTDFTHGNDWATWTTSVPKAGIYEVGIGYRAGSPKGYELKVNGQGQSGMFEPTGERFSSVIAGRVELKAGDNEISVGKGWGYYDLDYVELRPSRPYPMPKRPPLRLVDPHATAKTRALMRRLISSYGRKTLTGQYEWDDTNFVKEKVGVTPAIMGGDLMDYSPSRLPFGADPKNAVEKLIEDAKNGSIVTLSWHWNAPNGLINKKVKDAQGRDQDLSWYRGFYTNATTFDLAKALADRSSEEYRLILRDIDAIAIQLKKFADRDIPILWRPLHEAEGGWFWWGAKGPEPQKELWRILRERLNGKHNLHNLIWVYNSVDPAWYPGDGHVDIMTVDRYPADRTDALTKDWEDLQRRFDGKKLLGIAEFPGAPDIEKMHRLGARWGFFVSWTNELGARGTNPELLRRTYRSKLAMNR